MTAPAARTGVTRSWSTIAPSATANKTLVSLTAATDAAEAIHRYLMAHASADLIAAE